MTESDAEALVPVSWGSPRFHTRVVGPFEVTDAFFPPGASLEGHTHDRTVVALTLAGAIESRLLGRSILGRKDDLWTEPAGDTHANRVGPEGARVLVIQPDSSQADLFEPCRSLLEGVHHFRQRSAAHLARCMIPELRTGMGVDALMIEGLALQILAVGTRQARPAPTPSRWLEQALEVIHDRFREALTVAAIAEVAELHPSHFARAFKAATGVTVGRYVRRLRLDWAALQLRLTREPIGLVAVRAGFADQSHFTREFKAHVGTTPAQYRKGFEA